MATHSHLLAVMHFVIYRQPLRKLSLSSPVWNKTMRVRSQTEMRRAAAPTTTAGTASDVPVIRFPQAMVAKMERALDIKQRKDDQRRAEKWTLQKRTVLIQSSRKDRNFHLGESTNKYEAPLLASQSWKNKRSVGDHFTIKPMGDNPAMKDCAYDAVPGFEKFDLHQAVMDALDDMKLTVCTNIQNEAIPMILQGDNVLCASETGSGKTLAYLIPLVNKLLIEDEADADRKAPVDLRVNTPRALILVPSRELAQQVYNNLLLLLSYTSLNPYLFIGGERTQRKLNHPKYDAMDVLVSTPGVLSKLVTNRLINIAYANTVVIDEADTLVDDSFSATIRRIMSHLSVQGGGDKEDGLYTPGAQLLLVGATMPRSLNDTFDGIVPIDSLTRVTTKYLHRVMPHVRQTFHRTKPSEKSSKILELVKNGLQTGQTLMIFCKDSTTSDWLSRYLEEQGVVASNLNGAMAQRYRRDRFEQFQRGDFRCLVCTDIASRGLDTTFVSHVINYDFPQDVSDYIHRCGRTGRLGASDRGQVTSFITYPDEVDVVHKIEKAVRDATTYQNVNANITRRISVKYGMTQEDINAVKSPQAERDFV